MSCCPSTISDASILALLFVIAPQLKTTDPIILAEYAVLIEALRCMINEKALGCCATLAFANLLAHYLTISINPSTGIATSLSEGQLSIGLASTVGSGSFFSSTAYGQAYNSFLKRYRIGAYVTGSSRIYFGCCGQPRNLDNVGAGFDG